MPRVNTVINVKGSSSRKPSSGSWSGKITKPESICQIKSCSNKATCGMHVRPSSSSSSNKQYIIRGCSAHNNHHNTSEMKVKSGAKMARALK